MKLDLSFFNKKRVFITGHNGFKGTWLSKILIDSGADVFGYAIDPPTEPNLFAASGIQKDMQNVYGDIRDIKALKSAFDGFKPEIVMHLAAQPIVLESYTNPVYTYETNVMGTVNILECVRQSAGVRSFLNVTTDKVYYNNEWEWGYRENDVLNGFDPYSNSKSCSELVTGSYQRSFFADRDTAISTARAGNVIGGGDFATNRIVPDCFRSAQAKQKIEVRNPNSTRPYQHVLEPLAAYLMLVQAQYENSDVAGSYNIGPEDHDCVTTGVIAELFCRYWGDNQSWFTKNVDGPHEATFLKLDCSKFKAAFGWKPVWNIDKAMEKTVELYQTYLDNEDIAACMAAQIKEYITHEGWSSNV